MPAPKGNQNRLGKTKKDAKVQVSYRLHPDVVDKIKSESGRIKISQTEYIEWKINN